MKLTFDTETAKDMHLMIPYMPQGTLPKDGAL